MSMGLFNTFDLLSNSTKNCLHTIAMEKIMIPIKTTLNCVVERKNENTDRLVEERSMKFCFGKTLHESSLSQ